MSSEPRTLNLRVESEGVEGAARVHCGGRLTAETAARLKSQVQDMIPRCKQVVLDLSELTYMDSSGLGTVVGLYVSAKRGSCNLVLVNYNRAIRDLLGVTNLLSVFEACGRHGTRFL
jgi:anti-sigma B factor antagonist